MKTRTDSFERSDVTPTEFVEFDRLNVHWPQNLGKYLETLALVTASGSTATVDYFRLSPVIPILNLPVQECPVSMVSWDATLPSEPLMYWATNPKYFVDFLSQDSPVPLKEKMKDRINSLIRSFQIESKNGESPSLLSIRDFLQFLSLSEGDLIAPSLTLSATGLIRAEWSQNRERIILQFRGDEDVDYVVFVHHPKHRNRYQRKSGRCSRYCIFENLSRNEQRLLFSE